MHPVMLIVNSKFLPSKSYVISDHYLLQFRKTKSRSIYRADTIFTRQRIFIVAFRTYFKHSNSYKVISAIKPIKNINCETKKEIQCQHIGRVQGHPNTTFNNWFLHSLK